MTIQIKKEPITETANKPLPIATVNVPDSGIVEIVWVKVGGD